MLQIEYLSSILEPRAREYLQPALHGDESAALKLLIRASNSNRGHLAIAFWKAKVARPAYRKLLEAAWNHDHQHVTVAAGNRRRLRAMFQYAQFPLPDLPEIVRAWRGTSGMTKAQASKGPSWTLDRNVACWFATRFAASYGSPLVLTADIRRSSILHYGNERDEHEIVVLDELKVSVDGNQIDWRCRFDDWENRKKQEEMVRLSAPMKKHRKQRSLFDLVP